MSATMTKLSEKQIVTAVDRVRGAMWGMCIGDALAMPVHWYYSRGQFNSDWGSNITKYEPSKTHLQGSIMNLSNTGGAGRGSDKGNLVGDVILHGKKKYWEKGGDYYYHRDLPAGTNTLDLLLARLHVRSLNNHKGEFNPEATVQDYIKFMTTPGSHDDTYANSCHRIFFRNLVAGKDPKKCPGNDNHNVDAIDALTCLPPITLASIPKGKLYVSQEAPNAVSLIKGIDHAKPYTSLYAEILYDVVMGVDLREATSAAATKLRINLKRTTEQQSDPLVACYIQSSFPAMLHYAYKYADSFDGAVLASVNGLGENVARGATLGCLMGAAHGMKGIDKKWIDGLVAKDEINQEVEEFVAIFEANLRASQEPKEPKNKSEL